MSTQCQVYELSEGTVEIQVGHVLDYRNVDGFKELWRTQLNEGCNQFVINLANTQILDSTGMGAIFSLYRALDRETGQVVLANPTGPVRTIIQLLNAHKVFPVFPTRKAAVDSFVPPSVHC